MTRKKKKNAPDREYVLNPLIDPESSDDRYAFNHSHEVELADDEARALSTDLLREMNERDQLETDAKAEADEWRAKIKKKKAEILEIRSALSENRKWETTECRIHLDREAKERVWTLLSDPDTEIKREPFTREDRQLNLTLPEGVSWSDQPIDVETVVDFLVREGFTEEKDEDGNTTLISRKKSKGKAASRIYPLPDDEGFRVEIVPVSPDAKVANTSFRLYEEFRAYLSLLQEMSA